MNIRPSDPQRPAGIVKAPTGTFGTPALTIRHAALAIQAAARGEQPSRLKADYGLGELMLQAVASEVAASAALSPSDVLSRQEVYPLSAVDLAEPDDEWTGYRVTQPHPFDRITQSSAGDSEIADQVLPEELVRTVDDVRDNVCRVYEQARRGAVLLVPHPQWDGLYFDLRYDNVSETVAAALRDLDDFAQAFNDAARKAVHGSVEGLQGVVETSCEVFDNAVRIIAADNPLRAVHQTITDEVSGYREIAGRGTTVADGVATLQRYNRVHVKTGLEGRPPSAYDATRAALNSIPPELVCILSIFALRKAMYLTHRR